MPRGRDTTAAGCGSLLLLLLLLALFLLLQLLLTFRLLFFGGLLLARFDLGLMLNSVGLFLLKALLLLDAFLRFLRALAAGLVEPALEVALLLIVSPLIRRCLRRTDAALCLVDRVLTLLFLVSRSVGAALRSLGVALRLIELVLALLFFVSLSVARVFGSTLRRARLFLRALERCLLVTPARALGALFAVQRELLLANLCLHRAHLIVRLVQTVIDEERAVAVVFGNAVAIVIFLGALIEHLLPRVELAVERSGARRIGGSGLRLDA